MNENPNPKDLISLPDLFPALGMVTGVQAVIAAFVVCVLAVLAFPVLWAVAARSKQWKWTWKSGFIPVVRKRRRKRRL